MAALSSMIAWYARRPGMDERKTARHFKVSIHTVREAVLAWKTVETFGPVLKQAEQTISKIDRLGPVSNDWRKAEASRLREERRRCGISAKAAAWACKIPVRKYLAIERGDRGDRDPHHLSARIQLHHVAFDTYYVLNGERRGA